MSVFSEQSRTAVADIAAMRMAGQREHGPALADVTAACSA